MNVYYKIIGHLEDDEQETGTFIFNNEQPIPNIEKMFKSQLLEECGYDSDSNKEVKYEKYVEPQDFYPDSKRLVSQEVKQ